MFHALHSDTCCLACRHGRTRLVPCRHRWRTGAEAGSDNHHYGRGRGRAADQSNALRQLQWADLLPDDIPVFRPPTPLFETTENQRDGSVSGNVMWSETGQKITASPFGDADMPRAELNGQRISLAGYMTPLNVEDGMTRTFLLVPYVGACIHVPAPPPNQIVLVEAPEPVQVLAMWEPFKAVGNLRVETIDTGLGRSRLHDGAGTDRPLRRHGRSARRCSKRE